MLDSTLDLIRQAVSNHFYVFCLFNLIIVVILMDSKHGIGSNFNQDYEIPLSAPTYDKQDLEVKQLLNRSEEATNASRASSAYETAMKENGGNRYGCNANYTNDADEDGERDDELRRRVEEFIAKVNRDWRAEKLEMPILA